jgi:hypothetical protein
LEIGQKFCFLAGNYVFIETSDPRRPGDKAHLASPQVSGDQCVTFSYNMNGAGIGSLEVYQTIGARWVELFRKSTNLGDRWIKHEIQITSRSSYSVST